MSSQSIREVTPLRPFVAEASIRTQEQIERDVSLPSQRALDLHPQRDAVTCISSLPPELLAEIFMDYARQVYNKKRGKYPRPSSLMWIQVTHVCRHWRQVALSFPDLWTLLVLESPSWTEQMLIRSKMAPLVIEVDLRHLTLQLMETANKAFKHISRVRELRLTTSQRAAGKAMALLIGPAPLLESLALSETLFTTVTSHSATADLFSGQTPNLRKVTLESCEIMWPSSLLANLIHLDISHLKLSFRPSLSQLLTSLDRMPALRRCTLKDALPVLPENVMSVSSVPTEE
ncbi:hypothetical protein BJ138DRAFT_795388 [Hygrophoropsis aurantiaca]|uniref:Uncharacterized protein n=1 Tax=Hygrophoropsis aurantiaca TaxID=72124 RepID=A0ACB8AGY8_9AGAM|nr:hypothetical protein BJ138DRAFT_795388 [Hygrophoropsis aurantiaca]